jgi:O-antigen ligase
MPINAACFIALSVFGLMSVSKSFLLCWILLILFWLFYSLKQGVSKFAKFSIIAIICAAAIYFYAFDAINLYIFRFIENSDGTLGDLTTGRTDIWKRYIDTIFRDMRILFFGKGVNAVITGMKGTHNTYLEALFSLGFVGSALLVFLLKSCMGKLVSKPIMFIPVTILAVRMFAISMLTYDNLWFYLAIIVCLSRYTGRIGNGIEHGGKSENYRLAYTAKKHSFLQEECYVRKRHQVWLRCQVYKSIWRSSKNQNWRVFFGNGKYAGI